MTTFLTRLFSEVLFLFVTLFFCSCSGFFGQRQKARFGTSLESVTRTGDGTVTYTEDAIQNDGVPGKNVHRFRDELLSTRWKLRRNGVQFQITNRSSTTIRIDWDRAQYRVNGHKPRTPILSGGRHDLTVPQPEMTIAPGRSESDHFLPKGYVEYVDEYRKRRHPLFPTRQQTYESTRTFQQRARSWQDAKINITVPVTNVKNTFTYTFQFRVISVQFPKEKDAEKP